MTGVVKRECPECHRGAVKFVPYNGGASERSHLRDLVSNFGLNHRACAERGDLAERSKPHRCGDCGLELLFGETCPFHPGSHRVRWVRELALAYEQVVRCVAGGLTPSNRNVVEHQAITLAGRWGNVRPQRAEQRIGSEERVS